MLNYVEYRTKEFLAEMPKEVRKKHGQFFTSVEVARFMANLFTVHSTEVSILDPGAGSGILSIAFLERLDKEKSVRKVSLTCYETDASILPLLKQNLIYAQSVVSFELHFNILHKNYILSQQDEYNELLFVQSSRKKWDYVIGNPPYMKIGKNDLEAQAMPDICHGAPNLYFLFAMMSLFNLREQGELVYIMPRSWTSGAYFKAFRKKFLDQGKLEQIHLFASRDKVFDKVLQEVIIIKVQKTKQKKDTVRITSSADHAFSRLTELNIPYDVIVDDKEYYVYLITTKKEAFVIQCLKKWKNTLPAIGMRMKTGLTVDFRERQWLADEPSSDTIPMFFAQHLQAGRILYPCGKYGEYLKQGKTGLMQKNTNYLFCKRFTAKEEARRLQCAIYLAKDFSAFRYISTQNKINFIASVQDDLTEEDVYGLYVLFNSKEYDTYYRVLNGSTQVNSTEVNSMPVPARKIIREMGKDLLDKMDFSEKCCSKILGEYLYGED